MSAETDVPEVVRNAPVLREHAWNRMHEENQNWVAAVTGETGSGKSWAAIRLAEALDPNFTIDQVAFGVEEFLRLVIEDNYGKGSIIVFEEASVEASHHEWWSQGNKILKQVLETWRHQNRGCVFTLPAFGLLDKSARGRCHALVQMTRKDITAGRSYAKYKNLQQDSDGGDVYRHYHKDGGKEYRRITLRKPSKDIREVYEDRKENYTSELNRGLLEDLLEEQRDKSSEDDEKDPEYIAEEIASSGDVEDYIKEHPFNGVRSIDTDLIEVRYDIGGRRSSKVSTLLRADHGVEP